MELLQRRAGGGMGLLRVVYRSGAEIAAAVAAGNPVRAAAGMEAHFDESVRALLAAGMG